MSRLNRVVCAIFMATLLAIPPCVQAQKIRWKSPHPFKKHPVNTTRLSRTLADITTKRPDIRLSVARLDHAILLNTPKNQRPHATAFLFTTRYKVKKDGLTFNAPVVWAVTAGHNAQVGEKLRLTFYDGEQEIPVDGTLVQQGPALLSDAALIKLDDFPSSRLHPLELSTEIGPQEKLTTYGYAFNNFYKLDNLTFEKDNTRFLRTNFPSTQTKRAGLCGGPLLNAKGQVLGIHCGSSLDDKSYAASVRIIPYLLQAYYEGHAEIPLIAKDVEFGSIGLNERIIYIQCMNEHAELINQEDIYDQLPQSLLMTLYQDPEVRYLRFVLGSYYQTSPDYRVLVYDKKTGTNHFEPFRPR